MQKQMSIAHMEEMVELGAIAAVFVVPFPMSEKWALWAQASNGTEYVLTTARGEQREFASLKTVVEVLRAAGWRKPVTLHLV